MIQPKNPQFYGTRIFLTVLKSAHPWFLTQYKWIWFKVSLIFILFRFNIILRLRLYLPSCPLPSVFFGRRALDNFLTTFMRATFPTHLSHFRWPCNNIWRRGLIINVLIMQFFPILFLYFLSLFFPQPHFINPTPRQYNTIGSICNYGLYILDPFFISLLIWHFNYSSEGSNWGLE